MSTDPPTPMSAQYHESMKDFLVFCGESRGKDVILVVTVLEQNFPTEDADAAPQLEVPAAASPAGSPEKVPEISPPEDAIEALPQVNPAASNEAPSPNPAPSRSPPQSIDNGGTAEHLTTSVAGDEAQEAASTRTRKISHSEARERALRRIAIAKRVELNVKHYTELGDMAAGWIRRAASNVMTSGQLKRTDSVRGMLRRIDAILNPDLLPIKIPDALLNCLEESIEGRTLSARSTRQSKSCTRTRSLRRRMLVTRSFELVHGRVSRSCVHIETPRLLGVGARDCSGSQRSCLLNLTNR